MNQSKRNAMQAYFESKISDCAAKTAALHADDRTDEAVFVRIRMNVYDIFRTIFSVCEKSAGDDDQKLIRDFLGRLQQIPRNWHTSLAAAETHGDAEKAHIEGLKLDTIARISRDFTRIWEVEV